MNTVEKVLEPGVVMLDNGDVIESVAEAGEVVCEKCGEAAIHRVIRGDCQVFVTHVCGCGQTNANTQLQSYDCHCGAQLLLPRPFDL